MKVGILIKKPESVFCNGCIQQSFFVQKLLKKCGIECDLMSIENDFINFEVVNQEVVCVKNVIQFLEYDVVLMISLILQPSDENQKQILEFLKTHNIKIIDVICGNLFTLLQEEIVFDVHHIIKNYVNEYVNEYWILEMYDYMKDFIRMLTKKPVYTLSYVWDNDIILTYIEKISKELETNKILCENNNNKINIIIYEPNMSIHKNSLIPLLIAETYYTKYKCVNKVYIFNGTKMKENNSSFLSTLNITKDNKLETHGRIIMPETLNIIQKNNNFKNIVLSYTHLNNLNFLHLELFTMGYPIVHNCQPFKDNGLYYNDFDFQNAVECIEKARIHHTSSYIKTITKNCLETFSSTNVYRQMDWKKNLDRLCDIDIDIDIHIEEKQKCTPIKRFYNGEGVIIVDDCSDDITTITKHFRFSYELTNEIDTTKSRFKTGIGVLKSNIISHESDILDNIYKKQCYHYYDVFHNIVYNKFIND